MVFRVVTMIDFPSDLYFLTLAADVNVIGPIINIIINPFSYRFGAVSSTLFYALDDVNCISSSYLVILQCSSSTFIDSGCTRNSDEVSVICCKYIQLLCTKQLHYDADALKNFI